MYYEIESYIPLIGGVLIDCNYYFDNSSNKKKAKEG
jgi:hypothetical protein